MKLFFYKSLIVVTLFLITFHLTFNYAFKKVSIIINDSFSKDKIENIKQKIRSEIRSAIDKDIYINDEDAKLINDFIDKIKSDLKNSN